MKELIDKNLFDKIKIIQYETIPVVKDMECSNCHESDNSGFRLARANPIGWCDTPSGLMGVFECQSALLSFDAISIVQGDGMREYFMMILL